MNTIPKELTVLTQQEVEAGKAEETIAALKLFDEVLESGDYIVIDDPSDMCLDGHFTLDQLKAIVIIAELRGRFKKED